MTGPLSLTNGIMPDVCWTGSAWLVVWRVRASSQMLLAWFDGAGAELHRDVIDVGHASDSTFARLRTVGGRQWLAYRAWRADGWVLCLRPIDGTMLGAELTIAPRPIGNSPVALSADGWCAWQAQDTLTVEGLRLDSGEQRTLAPKVLPTGLAAVDGGVPVFVDDVRGLEPGMLNPVRGGDCVVGEGTVEGGIGVRFDDGVAGVILAGQNTYTPRVASSGDGHYAAVTWRDADAALVLFTRDDLAVAAAAPATFAFTHPVLVAPFKDPAGATSATSEIVVNQTGQTANRPYIVAEDSLAGPFVGPRLGIYTESADPSGAIALAEGSQTRVFACHDGPDPFPVTTLAKLRPVDVPMLELYLVAGETPDQRWDRWQENLGTLLSVWPGDVGVTLMFYCGGGAPPHEAFPIAAVLDGLGNAGLLVNSSSRIKVIAPFAYLRANGIIGHPELAAAFDALLTAAAAAGLATLTPVAPAPSPKPTPVPVPSAPIPLTPFPAARAWRGGSMRVFLKIGPYYTGVNPAAQRLDAHGKPLTGDQQFPVYWNRPGETNQGGAWETVELEQEPDGRFRATYVESQRVLSIQPDGSLQTRPAGTYGSYEADDAVTEPDPDPVNLLYRVDNGQILGTPLMIEEAQ